MFNSLLSIYFVVRSLNLSNNFIDGTLKIKRITLSNTSINKQFHISKIEPYVKIKLDKFNERTTKYLDSKELNNITWNNLNYSINCDNKCIQSSELIVEVWSHSSLNLNSDILISTSKIPLRKSGGYIGKEIEITRDLIIPGKEGSNGGKVTISCQLNETEIILKEQNLGTKYLFSYYCFFPVFFSFCLLYSTVFQYGPHPTHVHATVDPLCTYTYTHINIHSQGHTHTQA